MPVWRAQRVAAIALTGLVAVASTAAAQVTATGTLAGTVKDEQGAVIRGATVVLISESQGTKLAPVVTTASGDFVVPNVASDSYTVEICMPSFRPVLRTGVRVDARSRIDLGTITLEVGGVAQAVTVAAETPLVDTTSGERSFTVSTESVAHLPLQTRTFTSLVDLAPGMSGTGRIGGGGDSNVVIDGVTSMGSGGNVVLLQINTEMVAQVKVVTSAYQAEYGRSSGAQITAVTRSGTNHFRGSLYDVERNSDWNSNSRTNILNGDPKVATSQRDWGYSIGGPVGKPGGNNQLFFFFGQEWNPRSAGNDISRFRVPTDAERGGDFSQSIDQNGAVYNFIRDWQKSGNCNATSQAACFSDGGVVGRIPQDRLYDPGLAILKMFPLANMAIVPAGQSYNYEIVRPMESALSNQTSVRLDYQLTPALRATGKINASVQRHQSFNGSIPGYNDSLFANPPIFTTSYQVNYSMNSRTFVEGVFGQAGNKLLGCGDVLGGGSGPLFCTSGYPANPVANRLEAGLGGLPLLYPDANLIDPRTSMYQTISTVDTPVWDGRRIQLPPQFAWGNRVSPAPPTNGMPDNYVKNRTWDFSVNLTRQQGHHTIKTGFYINHQFRAVTAQRGNTFSGGINFAGNISNPFDTSFGYANAATGTFTSYTQATSFIETNTSSRNIEGYVQDNWKVHDRLTLDYGVRLVNQQPPHDGFGQASTFFADEWSAADAPMLYMAGCVNNTAMCAGANRQAQNPITGQLLGSGSSLLIGTPVPNSGDPTQALKLQGEGISYNTFIWPAVAVAPRVGAAYDLTGQQRFVVRGSLGLFFDRPRGNPTNSQVANPPVSQTTTIQFGQLQSLGTSGLSATPASALQGLWEYRPKRLPSSTQWNIGMQLTLPGAAALDVSYVGQHAWAVPVIVEINGVDLGAAYLPANQDPTLGPVPNPGAGAVPTDQMRAMRGYGSISETRQIGWRTYHSLQFSVNRRFQHGLSFSFNDTWSLSDHQNAAAFRYDHTPEGRPVVRADQADAERLLGTTVGTAHVMRASFVWDLPDVRNAEGSLERTAALLANDWLLSGIWVGSTGSPYTILYDYSNGSGTNVLLTGSPDYAARIRVAGDPGSGCGSDIHRQFNTAAFLGPIPGSLGLESGAGYVRGCFQNTLNLSIARTIRLEGSRNIQLRVDVFNAPNAAAITARNSTMQLSSPADPATITNLPFDSNGRLIDARSKPRGAGFGVATGYQSPRTVQLQVRFAF